LTWIGGKHAPPIPYPRTTALEDLDQALLYKKIWEHPETKAAVRKLAHSTNAWISDAAQVALKMERASH
jgi:hypothetical protein